MDLGQFRIPGSQEAFYIPNFVTEDEEKYLIRKIVDSPLPRWKNLHNRRLQILGGELTAKGALIPQAFPSYITEYPDIIGRIRSTGAFAASPHGQPNHVILNEYLGGQGIMPHEDGPSYFPVVATLSLGSHAVFHYYRYKPIEDAVQSNEDISGKEVSGKGRVIDKTPVISVLLEPRSLVITSGELYASHLHGIDDVVADVFPAPSAGLEFPTTPRIANLELISDATMKEVAASGGSVDRHVRYSLTCRDIARVVNRGVGFGRR